MDVISEWPLREIQKLFKSKIQITNHKLNIYFAYITTRILVRSYLKTLPLFFSSFGPQHFSTYSVQICRLNVSNCCNWLYIKKRVVSFKMKEKGSTNENEEIFSYFLIVSWYKKMLFFSLTKKRIFWYHKKERYEENINAYHRFVSSFDIRGV